MLWYRNHNKHVTILTPGVEGILLRVPWPPMVPERLYWLCGLWVIMVPSLLLLSPPGPLGGPLARLVADIPLFFFSSSRSSLRDNESSSGCRIPKIIKTDIVHLTVGTNQHDCTTNWMKISMSSKRSFKILN